MHFLPKSIELELVTMISIGIDNFIVIVVENENNLQKYCDVSICNRKKKWNWRDAIKRKIVWHNLMQQISSYRNLLPLIFFLFSLFVSQTNCGIYSRFFYVIGFSMNQKTDQLDCLKFYQDTHQRQRERFAQKKIVSISNFKQRIEKIEINNQ